MKAVGGVGVIGPVYGKNADCGWVPLCMGKQWIVMEVALMASKIKRVTK